jgi:DNA-binding MarR family transcriptional regulator
VDPNLYRCNATALRKASRRVTRLFDDALAPAGLRSTQYAVLNELMRRLDRAPSLQELADMLVMDRTALTHNLKPLQRDGFVALLEDDQDKRRRNVVLTAKGKALHRKSEKCWEKAQERVTELYGEKPLEALRGQLLTIAYDTRLDSLEGPSSRPNGDPSTSPQG